MAQEIRVVDTTETERGMFGNFFFVYELDPLIQANDGTTIIPTPSDGIPEEANARGIFDADDRTKFDAGTHIFFNPGRIFLKSEEVDTFNLALRKVRRVYASSTIVADLRARFRHTGRKENAVERKP